MRSLNQLRKLRWWLVSQRRRWLAFRYGLTIHPTASISLSAQFVSGGKGTISVGRETQIAFKSLIIAQTADGRVRPVSIGASCFIGGGAVILPGVTIADNCVVGAGAVVFEDTRPGTIVAGNPARVVRENADILPYGRLREHIEARYPA